MNLGVSVFQDDFLHNVAQDKPSYQVSTYTDHAASLANDGNVNSCARSQSETNPWWVVDLGAKILVAQVKLTNAGDDAGSDILFEVYCFINLVCIGWLGGVVERSRTSDSEVAGSSPTRTAFE